MLVFNKIPNKQDAVVNSTETTNNSAEVDLTNNVTETDSTNDVSDPPKIEKKVLNF